MSLAYRPDVDGLRGLAVSYAILYHAHIPPFRGGYTGVELFFVISGYLITSIIIRDMEEKRFSMVDFYDRRIRRIFPMLFALLAGVTILASLFLLPDQMREFARSLWPASFFYANVYFEQTLNYFGPKADEVPLLHLWTLSVEEQFYIIFPIVIVTLLKFGRRRLAIPFLIGVAIISFAYAQWLLSEFPEKAFYFLSARAWELMAGALLALVPLPKISKNVATVMGFVGLVLVVVPAVLYNRDTVFPGLLAMPSVIGAVCVIWAGETKPETVVTRIFSFPPLVYIGRISYSLYLWHLPFLVFAHIYKGSHLTYIQSGIVIAIAFGLSVLTYNYIETPMRRANSMWGVRPLRFVAGAVAIALALLTSRIILDMNGQLWPLTPRGAAAVAALEDRSTFQRNCNNVVEGWTKLRTIEECSIGPNAAKNTYDVLVWGDSHAGATFVGIGEEVASLGYTARLLTMAGCPPLIGGRARRDQMTGETCARFDAAVLDEIRRVKPKVVIMVGRWVMWTVRAGSGFTLTTDEIPGGGERTLANSRRVFVHMLNRTLKELESLGTRVIVLGQAPEYKLPPTRCVAQREYLGGDSSDCLDQSKSENLRLGAFANDLLKREVGAYPNASVFPLSDLFCTADECSAGSLEQGKEKFFYVDADHLSATGSRMLKQDPRFREALISALTGSSETRAEIPAPSAN